MLKGDWVIETALFASFNILKYRQTFAVEEHKQKNPNTVILKQDLFLQASPYSNQNVRGNTLWYSASDTCSH